MADLGFLPMVKRILDATPPKSQRLLFSATLDNGIDQLVRRYLNDPVTHSVDSAHSEVPDMTHHVLHVEAEDRVAVLIELAAAPGRTIVFTRTKHAAKKLTSKLTAARVPAVELHGNLTQGARTRNLAAFAEGRATTLVATDIAARGIHVDDVALVVHADPPMEHKAYLHRSGRTARAGSSGTVITLMTDAQVGEVRELTRKARIKATTTRTAPGDPFISTLAPGERLLVRPEQIAALTGRAPAAESDGAAPAPARSGGGNGSRNGNRRRRGTGGGGGASGPVATGSNGTGGTGGEVGAGGARQRGGAKKNSGAMKTGGTPKSGASQKNTERAARGSATGGAKAGGGSSRASSAAGKTGGAVAASRGFRSRRSG
jgi:superfamily II DNA/RNA helicase